MLAQRQPGAALRPFVETLWASSDEARVRRPRELMMPAGTMHIVFRLSDAPIRIFAGVADPTGRDLGFAVVGGARSSAYVRDAAPTGTVVGAELKPGAAEALLGASSEELAETHTPLIDLWGSAARTAREQLGDARSLDDGVHVLEGLLAARLPAALRIRPVVTMSFGRLAMGAPVRAVVMESGYSHRGFVAMFRRFVGTGPKTFARLLRFQRALAAMAAHPRASLADVAFTAGYSDQPHLNREFAALATISPGQYRAAAPSQPRHVPIGSISSKTRGAGHAMEGS